jgi:ribosomal protein S18 acetylase RimI-like enzyme
METANLLFQTRDGTALDVPFMANAWMNGLKDNASGTRALDAGVIVSTTMQFCQSLCIVSVDDPSFILGYICYEKFNRRNVVYWIYVKASFRKMGLGRQLITAAFGEMPKVSCATCPTPIAQISPFFTAVTLMWEYNPLLFARRMYAAGNQVYQHSQPSP